MECIAVDVLMEWLGEEEQLDITLKASMDTPLEEHVARANRAPDRLPVSFFILFFIFPFSLSGVVILMMLFLSRLQGVYFWVKLVVPLRSKQKRWRFWPCVLEGTGIEKEMGLNSRYGGVDCRERK